MNTYYLTFGTQYNREEHPAEELAKIENLADGWIEIEARSYLQARMLVVEEWGPNWAFLYSAQEWDRNKVSNSFPRGCHGVLTSDGEFVR